jgi:hypothetical protein
LKFHNIFLSCLLLTLPCSAQSIKVETTSGLTNVFAGQNVQVGQPIETGYNGNAKGLYVFQGGKWYAYANTKFFLKSGTYCKDGSGGRKSIIVVVRGVMDWGFPSRFEKLCSSAEFITNAGSYKVSGTVFRLNSEKGLTILGTKEGLVVNTAQNQTQYVGGGYWNQTIPGQPPGPPMAIAPLRLNYIGRPSAGEQAVVLPPGSTVQIGAKQYKGRVNVPLWSPLKLVGPEGSSMTEIVQANWGY